jgi:hypothetical protein
MMIRLALALIIACILITCGCIASDYSAKPSETTDVSKNDTGDLSDSDVEERLRSIGYLG